MYLSLLHVNVQNHPGRSWLRNLYHVHQRLCMAFPSKARQTADPQFLQPYRPSDFPLEQIHVTRGNDTGFLFRVDPLASGRVVVLVQSAITPDWNYAFHNARFLLAAEPAIKVYNPRFEDGQMLRFRLLANPTKKIAKVLADGSKTKNGRRVPVQTEKLLEWLVHRAASAGFKVLNEQTTVQAGEVVMKKSGNTDAQRLRSARYEGVLILTEAQKFYAAVTRGIGPGKAFGFGLLSVAPA